MLLPFSYYLFIKRKVLLVINKQVILFHNLMQKAQQSGTSEIKLLRNTQAFIDKSLLCETM